MFWIVFYLTLINGLVLIAALFSRRASRLPSRLFAIVIMAIIYSSLNNVLRVSGREFFWFTQQKWALVLWMFACLGFYFYVVAMTTPGFRFQKKHGWHLIPAVAAGVWAAVVTLLGPESSLYRASSGNRAELFFGLAVFAGYFGASQIHLHRHRAGAVAYVSNLSPYRLQWLQIFLLLLLPIGVLGFADLLTGLRWALWSWFPVIGSFIVVAIGFFALRQSAVFFPEQAMTDSEERNALLPPPEMEAAVGRLKEYMSSSRSYLDPELRLRQLSDSLRLRPQLISEVLNKGLGTNFYDFVNSYRVEEAKRRLRDPKYSHMNILGIATDCGFNSKSVFNVTFKRIAGITPSEFRSKTV